MQNALELYNAHEDRNNHAYDNARAMCNSSSCFRENDCLLTAAMKDAIAQHLDVAPLVKFMMSIKYSNVLRQITTNDTSMELMLMRPWS